MASRKRMLRDNEEENSSPNKIHRYNTPYSSAANRSVQADTIMKAPICLIENREKNGKLQFIPNHKAINILSEIQHPVVVVAIVGMYRMGKSYLMNKLAGAKGFSLGCTVQSQTKGIWMWCVPHPTRNDLTLVLLDTEGLGDVEKGNDKNDTWLFSLALLLSSMLVYNSRGTIDQNALDKLKFVLDISDIIKSKSTSDEDDDEEDEFLKYFPSFVWTVRDFTLQLVADGKVISEDEYMENALKLKEFTKGKMISKQDRDFNSLRENIQMFFTKRKCFAFGIPTADESLLQRLEDVPDSELPASFVAQIQNFCHYVFKNAKVKKLAPTVPVTGHRLGELAKIYTEAINSNNIVYMEEAKVSLAEKENIVAVQEGTQHYEDMMKTVELPTDDFETLSQKYEQEAEQKFNKKSYKDKDKQFFRQFSENIQKKKYELSNINKQKSCEAFIKKLSVEFEKALSDGTYFNSEGHEKFKIDLKAIEKKYIKTCGDGKMARKVLQKYKNSIKEMETNILQQDKKRAEEINNKKIKELEENIKELIKNRAPVAEIELLKEMLKKLQANQDVGILAGFGRAFDNAGRKIVDCVVDTGTKVIDIVVDAGEKAIDIVVDAGEKAIDIVVDAGEKAIDIVVDAGEKAIDIVVDAGEKAIDNVAKTSRILGVPIPRF